MEFLEREYLLIDLCLAAGLASNAWARNFTASILKQSKRRNWNPSPKQAGIMRRLVSELFTENDEMELIEE